MPEPDRAREVGEREGGGDDDGSERRLRQVAQQARDEDEHEPDRDRADEPGHLRLCAGLLRHGGARAARADREALEEPGADVRSPDPDHLLAAVSSCPVRSAKADAVAIVSASATTAMPSAPPTRSARSESSRLGTVSGGNPFGSVPTSFTPWSRELEELRGADREHDRGEDAGDLRQDPLQRRGSRRARRRRRRARRRPSCRRRPRRRSPSAPSMKPSASTEKPKSFGSWPDEDREREPVHVADHRRLREQVGDEAEPQQPAEDHERADEEREREASSIARAGSPWAPRSGRIVAAIMGPSDESGPSTRIRDGPKTA